jgi:hypothetical protein
VGYSSLSTSNSLNVQFPGILVNQTAPVATAGVYYFTASALLRIDSGDTGGDFCYTTTANNGTSTHSIGGSSLLGGFQTISMTDVFTMAVGDSAELWCYDADTGNGLSGVFNSSLTAILINSAFDAKKPRPLRVHPE